MAITDIVGEFGGRVASSLIPVGATFSLTSLQCAFIVGALAIAARRKAKGRKVEIKPLLRMMFPRKLAHSSSLFADVAYYLFNVVFYGAIFGWTILSYKWIATSIPAMLDAYVAAPQPHPPIVVASAILTLMAFLGYELGYWVDHYTSHRIPFFWEIHKVDHTAEHLTPLTVWRVHPIETAKAYNITAMFIAAAHGLTCWALGETPDPFAISGRNVLLVLFMHLYVHLQHSNIWIAFPGAWSRIFLSPAAHQIHHSRDPRHFNANLGSCLAIFDTLFGTLRAPAMTPEKLQFGVDGEGAEAHRPMGLFVTPVVKAFAPAPLPEPGVAPR